MANEFYIVSLADVRRHLRIPDPNTQDDMMLSEVFIPAANNAIEHECGSIIPKQHDETYDGGKFEINLRHIPVYNVDLVEEGWGYTNYTLDYVQVNSSVSTSMFAYSVDNPSFGTISRRSGGNVNIKFMSGNDNIRIVYSAGRQTVPGIIKLATLELIGHWYRGSQQRQAQYQSSGFDQLDMDQPMSGAMGGLIGMNLGVPAEILEMLKPYRHMPFIG